jgi:hypothetical protein
MLLEAPTWMVPLGCNAANIPLIWFLTPD